MNVSTEAVATDDELSANKTRTQFTESSVLLP